MAHSRSPKALGLGPLEAEIMATLWRRGPALAADVAKVLNRRRDPPLAYTTVVNVLTNLEVKGVVSHVAVGRAYRFGPTVTEAELRERRARGQARALFEVFSDEAVSAIVGEVCADPVLAERFRQLLDVDNAPGRT